MDWGLLLAWVSTENRVLLNFKCDDNEKDTPEVKRFNQF